MSNLISIAKKFVITAVAVLTVVAPSSTALVLAAQDTPVAGGYLSSPTLGANTEVTLGTTLTVVSSLNLSGTFDQAAIADYGVSFQITPAVKVAADANDLFVPSADPGMYTVFVGETVFEANKTYTLSLVKNGEVLVDDTNNPNALTFTVIAPPAPAPEVAPTQAEAGYISYLQPANAVTELTLGSTFNFSTYLKLSGSETFDQAAVAPYGVSFQITPALKLDAPADSLIVPGQEAGMYSVHIGSLLFEEGKTYTITLTKNGEVLPDELGMSSGALFTVVAPVSEAPAATVTGAYSVSPTLNAAENKVTLGSTVSVFTMVQLDGNTFDQVQIESYGIDFRFEPALKQAVNANDLFVPGQEAGSYLLTVSSVLFEEGKTYSLSLVKDGTTLTDDTGAPNTMTFSVVSTQETVKGGYLMSPDLALTNSFVLGSTLTLASFLNIDGNVFDQGAVAPYGVTFRIEPALQIPVENMSDLFATTNEPGMYTLTINSFLFEVGKTYSVSLLGKDGTVLVDDTNQPNSLSFTVVATPEEGKSSDVTLKSITENLEANIDLVALTLAAKNSEESVILTVVPTSDKATVVVKNANATGAVALNVGENKIEVVVTAEDGTTKTYTITVTRAVAPAPVVTPPSNNSNNGGGGGGGGGGFVSGPVPGNPTVVVNLPTVNLQANTIGLTVSATNNPTDVAISLTSDFVGASWVPFASSLTWNYGTSADPSRTVHVKFRNANGQSSVVTTSFTIPAVAGQVIPGPGAPQVVLGEQISLVDELIAKTKYLQKGKDVTSLQDELRKLGFFPKTQKSTGFYGSITLKGVKDYQKSKGMVKGVKIASLEALIAKTKAGQKNNDVVALQNELKAKGFMAKTIGSTGWYGPLTNAAVKKYQASVK